MPLITLSPPLTPPLPPPPPPPPPLAPSRRTFLYDQQFHVLCRILNDQSQPMNNRVKQSWLEYVHELIPSMNSEDFKDTPGFIYLSIYLSITYNASTFIYLSMHRSISYIYYLSIYCLYLSIYLSILYLSIYLSFSLFRHQTNIFKVVKSHNRTQKCGNT